MADSAVSINVCFSLVHFKFEALSAAVDSSEITCFSFVHWVFALFTALTLSSSACILYAANELLHVVYELFAAASSDVKSSGHMGHDDLVESGGAGLTTGITRGKAGLGVDATGGLGSITFVGVAFTGGFASAENIGVFDVVAPPNIIGAVLVGPTGFGVILVEPTGLGVNFHGPTFTVDTFTGTALISVFLLVAPSIYVGDISPANTNVNINITNNHNGVVKLIMNLYSYQIK